MLVFRIETDDGFGPYNRRDDVPDISAITSKIIMTGSVSEIAEYTKSVERLQMAFWEDEGLKHVCGDMCPYLNRPNIHDKYRHFRFACKSKEDLLYWFAFRKQRKFLKEAGYKIHIYDSNAVFYGEHQVMFDPVSARKLGVMPIPVDDEHVIYL